MHLLWMWALVVLVFAVTILIVITWRALELSGEDGFAALIVPALAPFKELGEQIRENLGAARTKENAEKKLAELWDVGMSGGHVPTIAELRSIQDKTLIVRQGNPYIPDWFDQSFHRSNEVAMRGAVVDRIVQANRHGHAG